MGNLCNKCCSSWTTSRRRGVLMVPLVMIGSSGAGKTYIANRMRNKTVDQGPTLGCHVHTISQDSQTTRITEIGGTVDCAYIRNEFLQSCMGVIFVFNASLANSLAVQKLAIQSLLTNPFVIGKPTLVFATHNDLIEIGEQDIVESLQLDFLSHMNQTPINLIACGADDIVAYKQGFDWINEFVIQNFKQFANRIQFDRGSIDQRKKSNRRRSNAVRPKTAQVEQRQLPSIIQVTPSGASE